MTRKDIRPAVDQSCDLGVPAHVDLRVSFASSFRDWRLKKNLTLKEIAMDLGISISTVNAWELGQRFPSYHHFGMLMNYTALSPCELLGVAKARCLSSKCDLVLVNTGSVLQNQPPVSTTSRI